jgi:hypothetical protein
MPRNFPLGILILILGNILRIRNVQQIVFRENKNGNFLPTITKFHQISQNFL